MSEPISRAYELLDPLVAQFPTVPRYREAMSHVCNGLGGLEYETGRVAECETHWKRELGETERLVAGFSGPPRIPATCLPARAPTWEAFWPSKTALQRPSPCSGGASS